MNLDPVTYAAIQRAGIPAHFEIDLPSDKDVFLETGVYDWESGKLPAFAKPMATL